MAVFVSRIRSVLALPSAIWLIALTALFFRLILLLVKPPGFPPGWGGEMASVATSLAQGDGFSSPYWQPTGPTALVPPVYPFLLSILYRIFGVHTELAGQVTLLVSVCLSALTTLPIILIGRNVFGKDVGLIAGALWALYPLTGHSDFLFNWDSSFFTLLLTLFFLSALEMKTSRTGRAWLGFGLLAGFTILTETVSLLFVLSVFGWFAFKEHLDKQKLIIALTAVLLVTVPWIVRNSIVFGQPVFLRTNLGLELYRGLMENDFRTMTDPRLVPGRDPGETESYRELGEIAYMQSKLSITLNFIAQHPGEYAVRTIERAIAYWAGDAYVVTIYWFFGRLELAKHILYAIPSLLAGLGLGLGIYHRVANLWLFMFLVIVYPMIYYFTLTQVHYRAPIEPELLVLSAFSLNQLSVLFRPRMERAWQYVAGK